MKKLLAISYTSHFTDISSCNLLCHKSSYCVGYNYIRGSNLCELFDYAAIKEGVMEDDPESMYAHSKQVRVWCIIVRTQYVQLVCHLNLCDVMQKKIAQNYFICLFLS